jgi:hypothetical protein
MSWSLLTLANTTLPDMDAVRRVSPVQETICWHAWRLKAVKGHCHGNRLPVVTMKMPLDRDAARRRRHMTSTHQAQRTTGFGCGWLPLNNVVGEGFRTPAADGPATGTARRPKPFTVTDSACISQELRIEIRALKILGFSGAKVWCDSVGIHCLPREPNLHHLRRINRHPL